MKLIFHEHKGRYGYRHVTAEMHNRGFMLQHHKTVQWLMGDLRLKSKIRRVRYQSYKSEIGKNSILRFSTVLSVDFVGI
ncbi:transposase [Bacteroides bouchesdurhonensis]